MAENHSTQLPKEEHENPIDALTRKSAQLSALLSTTYGNCFESFEACNDTIKQNYLWACADLAHEVEVLASHMACNGI